EEHQVELVADVRSVPRSRFSQFNALALDRALRGEHIAYASFGATLGGRPEDPELYDAEGHVRYDRLATTAAFLAGIERTRPAGQQALFAVETAIVTVVEEQGCKPAWFKVLGSNGAPEPPARRSAEQQQLRQRDLE
ncbi:MAG: DUF488 domain-containing protein, partial [Actinomycetota bacterium]|nr:DUF488 domain-containing protein [Actinomycetota bacterium]